jgi:hypothetical protein
MDRITNIISGQPDPARKPWAGGKVCVRDTPPPSVLVLLNIYNISKEDSGQRGLGGQLWATDTGNNFGNFGTGRTRVLPVVAQEYRRSCPDMSRYSDPCPGAWNG